MGKIKDTVEKIKDKDERLAVERRKRAGASNPVQRAIDAAKPGDVLDFGHRRVEQTQSVFISTPDLTIQRLFLYGPTLTPASPSVWVEAAVNLKLEQPVIVGAADTGGKFNFFSGHKQHLIMAGSAKNLWVSGGLLALAGADWMSLGDKPGGQPCYDVVVEDTIFYRSRRQGIAPSGVRGMLLRKCITSDAQRTLLDFESEGGGAHSFVAEDNSFDCFTRRPNAVISIGGANRAGAANEGPFTLRRNRVYGLDLTVNNRSRAKVIQESNSVNLPPNQFPALAPLIESRFPGLGLPSLLGL